MLSERCQPERVLKCFVRFALAQAAVVWNYVGEILFNMLVLVGAIKMSGRLIRELMELG